MSKESKNIDGKGPVINANDKVVAWGSDLTPFFVDQAGIVYAFDGQKNVYAWDKAREAWLYVAG